MRAFMRMAAGLAAMALGIMPAAAQTASVPPQGVTTGALADLCAADGDAGTVGAASVGYCRGFLIAAGQYHNELTQGTARRPPVFCLTGSAPTVEASQSAFVAWARANPQYAAEKALIGLMRWAASAYPCAEPPAPARAARR